MDCHTGDFSGSLEMRGVGCVVVILFLIMTRVDHQYRYTCETPHEISHVHTDARNGRARDVHLVQLHPDSECHPPAKQHHSSAGPPAWRTSRQARAAQAQHDARPRETEPVEDAWLGEGHSQSHT